MKILREVRLLSRKKKTLEDAYLYLLKYPEYKKDIEFAPFYSKEAAEAKIRKYAEQFGLGKKTKNTVIDNTLVDEIGRLIEIEKTLRIIKIQQSSPEILTENHIKGNLEYLKLLEEKNFETYTPVSKTIIPSMNRFVKEIEERKAVASK